VAANGTGLSHTTRQTEAVWPDGVADLVAPVAVRVIDLRTPIEGFWLPRTRSWETYRSLLAIGRHDGYPPVLSSFSVGMDGHVSRDRLERGLRRSLEHELHKRRPHWPGDGSFAADEKLLTQRGSPRPALSTPVSVVVPTCANPEQLVPCLRSILRCNYDNLEVIVVENRPGSADTARVLATRFAGETRLRYVEEPRAGASWARNAGLAQAEGELVAFADEHARCGVAGPKMVNPDGTLQASRRSFPTVGGTIVRRTPLRSLFPPLRWQRRHYLLDAPVDDPLQVDTMLGAFLLMRRAMLEEIGGWDAGYKLYVEDIDLSYRAMKAGWERWWVPSAVVHHEYQAVIDKHFFTRRNLWHLQAMLRFLRKHPERLFALR